MGTHTLNDALAAALTNARIAAPDSGRPRTAPAPVLPGSIEAGTFEQTFFTVPAKGETDRLLRAARRLLDRGRQLRREARRKERVLTLLERRITSLSAASVRVFEELLSLSRLNGGRIYPSYDHLAEATALGRASVARALRILEGLGLLIRQRRFKRVKAEGPGPRYAQTSNAYRTFLPRNLLAYLPRWIRQAPVPADAEHRCTHDAQDLARMHGTLSCQEFAHSIADGKLARSLGRLGAALDRKERESQNEVQPLTQLNYNQFQIQKGFRNRSETNLAARQGMDEG